MNGEERRGKLKRHGIDIGIDTRIDRYQYLWRSKLDRTVGIDTPKLGIDTQALRVAFLKLGIDTPKLGIDTQQSEIHLAHLLDFPLMETFTFLDIFVREKEYLYISLPPSFSLPSPTLYP